MRAIVLSSMVLLVSSCSALRGKGDVDNRSPQTIFIEKQIVINQPKADEESKGFWSSVFGG